MEDTHEKIKCPNCENEYDNSFKYCPHCGQKNIAPDPKLRYFFSEFLSANFNLDSKIFITLKYLVLKPAVLSKEFMAGKREKYITPVRLYLFISLIYFFVLSLNTHKESNIVDINNPDVAESDSSNFAITIDDINPDTLNIFEKRLYHNIKLLEKPIGQQMFERTMKKNFSLGMFIFIPLTALILYLLFRRKTKYYIPNLIFATHLQTMIFLWFTIFILIEFVLDYTVIKVAGLIFVAYTIFRWIKAFYSTSTAKTLWKMLVFFAAWFFLLIIFMGIVLGFSFWFLE